MIAGARVDKSNGAELSHDEMCGEYEDEIVRLQRAIDKAHAAMHGSQYVGGPTEREAWRTTYGALSRVATQHIAAGSSTPDPQPITERE